MAEKQLNVRVQLKYDTYTNWTTNNPVLKAGEMAIATIASGNTQEVNSVTPPQVLIKVGDGSSHYNSLPFVSAKAADVYSWAKADTKPTYSAAEITGLSDYISGAIQDTDTQYQLVKVDEYNYKLQSKTLNGAWADVEGSTIAIPNDTAAIEALQGLVGETAVATQIATAINNLQTTVIDKKVDSVKAGDASVVMGGTATAPTVAVQLDATAGNAIELVAGKGLRVEIPEGHNQTIKGNGTAFGADDAVDIVSADANLTVTADASTKKITLQSKNQTVKSGTVVFDADAAINIVSGDNVTVTPKAADNSITISSSYVDTNQKVKAGSVTFEPNDNVEFKAGTHMGTVVGDASAKTITINGKDWTQDITDAVNAVATAAMEFKGAVTALPTGDLRKGDTYKVAGAFTVPVAGDAEGKGFSAKVGDTIVYDGSKWYLIPSGDDIEDTWRPVTDVDNDATLSFAAGEKLDVNVAATGAITYSHEAIAAPTGTATTSRKYINGITTDGYGHITGFTTHQETDQDLSNFKTKQTAVSETGAVDKTLKISQNANGEVTATPVDISIAHTQVNDWDANIGVKEIKADTGLKVVTSGTGLSAQVPQIAIDEAVTFVFNCGSSSTLVD